MPPRSFSEDGAFGAGSSDQLTGDKPIDDSGMTPFSGIDTASAGGHDPFQATGRGGGWSVTGVNGFPGTAARFFSEGGAIDEGDPNATDPQGSGLGNSLQASINAALGVVDNVLSYGRKLHGLGGGDDDEGAIKGTQTAGRMPSVPGTPSDSGVRPVQPAPGALPPTSNPFGKRADASQDSPPEEGAIPTDEEETA